jgi:hypothetical protein
MANIDGLHLMLILIKTRYAGAIAGFSPGMPGEGKNIWQKRD